LKYIKLHRNQIQEPKLEYYIVEDDLHLSMSDQDSIPNDWIPISKIPTNEKYMVLLKTYVGFHEDIEIIKSKRYNKLFERILTDLKNDKCMLVTFSNDFYCGGDSNNQKLLNEVQKILDDNQINPNNFVMIYFGYFDITRYDIKFKVLFGQNFFGIQDTFKRSFDLDEFRISCTNDDSIFFQRLFANQNKYKRPNKFITYNGSIRPHRLLLLKFLYENDLLKHGLYSFFVNQWKDNKDWVIQSMKDNFGENNNLLDIIPTSIDHFSDNYLSWGEDLNIQAHYSSYFEIVTETLWDSDTYPQIFSEKVAKPLLTGLPFVLLQRPHGLKKLQDFGFKTFHPYIDESYDDEMDTEKRFNMISDEIKRILDMEHREIHNWFLSMKDILLHNIRHLHFFVYQKQIELRDGIEESWDVFIK